MIYIFSLLFILVGLVYYSSFNGGIILNFPTFMVMLELFRVVLIPVGIFDGFYGVVLVLYLFVLIIAYRDYKFSNGINKVFIIFMIMCLYYLSQTAYSEGVFNGISRVSRFMFMFFCFFIAYKKIDTLYKFERMTKSIFTGASLFVIATIIFTIFQYGKQRGFIYGYVQGELYFLSLFVIIIVPFFVLDILKNNTSRFHLYYLPVVSLLILAVSLSRTTWAIIVIGSAVYLTAIFKYKRIKKVFIAGLFLVIISGSIVISSGLYMQRANLLEEDYELQEENRYLETLVIYYDYLNSPQKKIFGTGDFFVSNISIMGNPNRVMHSTYNRILHGTGFFGLFLFFVFNLSILYRLFITSNEFKHSHLIKISGVAVLSSFLFATISGVTYPIAYSALTYFYSGAALRIAEDFVPPDNYQYQ